MSFGDVAWSDVTHFLKKGLSVKAYAQTDEMSGLAT